MSSTSSGVPLVVAPQHRAHVESVPAASTCSCSTWLRARSAGSPRSASVLLPAGGARDLGRFVLGAGAGAALAADRAGDRVDGRSRPHLRPDPLSCRGRTLDRGARRGRVDRRCRLARTVAGPAATGRARRPRSRPSAGRDAVEVQPRHPHVAGRDEQHVGADIQPRSFGNCRSPMPLRSIVYPRDRQNCSMVGSSNTPSPVPLRIKGTGSWPGARRCGRPCTRGTSCCTAARRPNRPVCRSCPRRSPGPRVAFTSTMAARLRLRERAGQRFAGCARSRSR